MNIKYKIIGALLKQKTITKCHNILFQKNSYYRNLSEVNKHIFIIRTVIFLWTTNFNSEPSFHLDEEMKIIISSAFVQITFGLKIMTLNEFNNIFITPKSYSYKNNNEMYDGDVNRYTKKVNMSWPAIERGFEISDDAINLAIHEFGHCLIFENSKKSYLSRIFNENDFEVWQAHALQKLRKIKLRKNKVFRDYAGRNLIELFSVSLEVFFEQPEIFMSNEPELYISMTKLLKQDPRFKSNLLLDHK